MNSRVTLEIDLAKIEDNFHVIAAAAAPLGVIAVLKADAYGLGVQPIAETVARAGAAAIAVAELSEALAVVHLGLPVLMLGTVLPDEIEEALRAGVRIPVAGLEEARAISAAAARLGVAARCHIALDTGMGRIGVQLREALEVAPRVAELPCVVIEGVYSHFPSASNVHDPISGEQVEGFKALAAALRAEGLDVPWLHIANSDGINNVAAALKPPFTHVRTGLNLYGLFDNDGAKALDIKPVLAMKARLAQVRTLAAGDTIGYGRTFACPRAMRVGTVAAGYADGLPLALSNRGALLIRGRLCPVVGRVSMDYTTVALDQCDEAQAGDEVFCVGGDFANAIPVSAWAAAKGTHPYEVICSIGRRVERRHFRK